MPEFTLTRFDSLCDPEIKRMIPICDHNENQWYDNFLFLLGCFESVNYSLISPVITNKR